MSEARQTNADRVSISVAICTFRRNDLLTRLLDGLIVCAERVSARAAVGVVLVDDTADGQARPVADEFADRFEGGVTFKISGRQNISLARNLAIETALELADFVVITDDDCEPPPQWLDALLDMEQRTGADGVTGRMVRRVPPGSPAWITEQPFLELGVDQCADGAKMETAAAFNTLLASRWLKDHPEVRFDPHFGVIGGEDVVFFRTAVAAGFDVRFSEAAFIYENEPADRATFAYQLYVYFWHGNSAALACIENGMSRGRYLVHVAASFARALARPLTRLFSGKAPQLRFALAQMLHATGKLLGLAGLKIRHR